MLQISQLANNKTASFAQPLSLLRSCHDKILHFSAALYELSVALEKEAWNASYITTADQIRRYFNIAGPEHHLDEEHHLFPAIMSLDPTCKDPQSLVMIKQINELIKEHVESDQIWQQLDTLLAEQSTDFQQLQQLSLTFKNHMIEHAGIENNQIFPFAEKYISEAEFKKMGKAIAKRRGVKA